MVFSLRLIVLFCVCCSLFLAGSQSGNARPLANNEDTVRQFKPRKVLLLTDTSEAAQLLRNRLFYEKLKNRFYRRDITRGLYHLLFSSPQGAPRRSSDMQDAIEYFQQFQGKTVRNISIKKLPIFGPTVNDTTRTTDNWLQQAGNALHFQTRDWVLQKNLLFEEGDGIDPELFYDNERLLRQLSYIRDARIRLVPVPENPALVDVIVVTQDVFPLSFDVGTGAFSSYSVAVQNRNIFGIGHRLTNEVVYSSDGSPQFGYAGAYSIENVRGTFVNTTVHGAYTDYERGVGLSLQRPFFTPDIHWAGGLDLQRTNRLMVLPHRFAELDTLVRYAQDWLDVWAGYAIPLKDNKYRPEGREAIVLAGRALRVNTNELPDGELSNRYFFQDKKVWMGSVGWVRRSYRRDAYIYSFGRTEDVPTGARLSTTLGVEEHDQQLMYYGQLSGAWGKYLRKFGYLNAYAGAGQYLGESGSFSRDLRFGGINWISQLLPQGRYRIRQLLDVNYLLGDNRFEYEFISIGDRHVRGLRGVDARGTQRLSFSSETIVFSPLQVLSFQLASFVFADVAVLNDSSHPTLKGNVLQGYGLGFRVRNENLAFKTFQLRFAYYPVPGGGFSIRINGSPSGTFQDFTIGKPNFYPFE